MMSDTNVVRCCLNITRADGIMRDIYEMKYHVVGYDKLNNRQHTHTASHELLLFHSDGGTMLVNDNIYPIKKDTLFIINANYIHCSNPSNPSTYERSAVLFNTNYMRSVLSVLGITDMIGGLFPSHGGIQLILNSDTSKFVNECFSKMDAAARGQSPYKRAEITNMILTVMFRLAGEGKSSVFSGESGCNDWGREENGNSNILISEILGFINRNLSDDVSADRIATQIGINRSYLCRLFHKKTTMTLTQYVTEQRLALSKSMLLQTGQNILEVALACGFNSPSYFCRVFRKAYGMSPQACRQVYKDQNMIIPDISELSGTTETDMCSK